MTSLLRKFIHIILFCSSFTTAICQDSLGNRISVQAQVGYSVFRYLGIGNDIDKLVSLMGIQNNAGLNHRIGEGIRAEFSINRFCTEEISFGLLIGFSESNAQFSAETNFVGAVFQTEYSIKKYFFSPIISFSPKWKIIEPLQIKLNFMPTIAFAYLQKDIRISYSFITNIPGDSLDWFKTHLRGKYDNTLFEAIVSISLEYQVLDNLTIAVYAGWDNGFSGSVKGTYFANSVAVNRTENLILQRYFNDVSLNSSGSFFGIGIKSGLK